MLSKIVYVAALLGLPLSYALPTQSVSTRVVTFDSPFRSCGAEPEGNGACAVLNPKIFDVLSELPMDQPIEFNAFDIGLAKRALLRVKRFSVVPGVDDGDNESGRPDVILLRGGAFAENDPSLLAAGEESFDFRSRASVFIALSPYGSNGFIELGDKTYIISTPEPSDDQPEVSRFVQKLAQGADATLGAEWRTAQVHLPTIVFDAVRANVHIPLSDNDVDRSGAASSEALMQGEPIVNLRKQFTVATEVDYDMYVKKGYNTNAVSSWYASLIGATSSIYLRDFGVSLASSSLKVYTARDPYPCCSTSEALTYMQRTWSRTTPARSVAAFLSARNMGGGIAYYRTLCNRDYGYSVSANMNGYFPTPVQSYNGQNWDLYVFAHEIGHTFGASHTHELNPPVDRCGSTPGCSATRGTIMSYCHLCSGGISNIDMRFDARTVSEVRSYIDYISC